jgi:hypothetical protein
MVFGPPWWGCLAYLARVRLGYAKMSAKEKETLKWRMAEIDKAAKVDEENMPPSLTPK